MKGSDLLWPRRGLQRSLGLASLATVVALAGCERAPAPDCAGLTVDDAWVRAAATASPVMGGYFVLRNEGDADVIVNGATSSQFERVELHRSVVSDGQATMEPIESVTVPVGGQVEFAVGGRHVMLFNPSQDYVPGDQVELVLSCGSEAAELPVAATVRAQAPDAATGQSQTPEGTAHGPAAHDAQAHESMQTSGDDRPAD